MQVIRCTSQERMAGTAHPVEYYVADFRGPRSLVRLVEERRRR